MALGDLLLPAISRWRRKRLQGSARESLDFERIPGPVRRVLRIEAREGLPAPPVVGAVFKAGERLGCLGSSQVLAPVHSKVVDVAPVPYVHGGKAAVAVTLETGTDSAETLEGPDKLPFDAPKTMMLERLERLGVTTFGADPEPISTRLDADIATLIVNAADQEPLLSSQSQLLRERGRDVEAVLELLKRLSGAREALLAVPVGLERIGSAAGVRAIAVPRRYPEALHEMVARRAVRAGVSKPIAAVTFEEGLATLKAIVGNERTFERYLTVIEANETRRNVIVGLGTPVEDIAAHVDFPICDGDRVVAGGPMRGRAEPLLEASVDIMTEGLMIVPASPVGSEPIDPCVSCGSCIDACPSMLQPNELGRNAEFGLFDRNRTVESCLRCGLCAYLCPSCRPNLQWIELTIQELRRLDDELERGGAR